MQLGHVTPEGSAPVGPAGAGEPVPAGGSADSAGQPWSGRSLPPGEFGADDGSADPALAAALTAVEAGRGAAADVVAALGHARVVVAVVAVLGEGEEQTATQGDKTADMALVTLTGPDGRRGLPVFSSTAALAAWDTSARPVPVTTRRAAHAALAEGCERLVLDPSGPTTFLASRSAVVALAQGRTWSPAHADPDVARRLDELVEGDPDVLRVARLAGKTAELRVELAVRPGLTREQLTDVASRVGERLAGDEVLRERADGLELAVVPAR